MVLHVVNIAGEFQETLHAVLLLEVAQPGTKHPSGLDLTDIPLRGLVHMFAVDLVHYHRADA